MKNFRTQYSLGNNQYPETLTGAADVLTNHPWDNTYKESKKRKRTQRQEAIKKAEAAKSDKKNDEGTSMSFAQHNKDLRCFCCGKSDHLLPDCPDKEKIPRSKWAMSKGMQLYDS